MVVFDLNFPLDYCSVLFNFADLSNVCSFNFLLFCFSLV